MIQFLVHNVLSKEPGDKLQRNLCNIIHPADGRIMSMKNLNDHIGKRTRDLLPRSAVIGASALLGVYEASVGIQLQAFRYNLSSPHSRVLLWLFLEIGTIVCPQMSLKKQRINAE